MKLWAGIALAFAAEKHIDQTDKAGDPYIFHCIRVGMKFEHDWLRTIGFLHDILEDTDAVSDDLHSLGLPAHIIQNVQVLTRVDGQTYEQYIDHVSAYPDARRVKIADLEDNMNLTRITRALLSTDVERFQKYHKAWLRLTA